MAVFHGRETFQERQGPASECANQLTSTDSTWQLLANEDYSRKYVVQLSESSDLPKREDGISAVAVAVAVASPKLAGRLLVVGGEKEERVP